jgi:outer membrane protein
LIQAYGKMKDAKSEFESMNENLSREFDSVATDFQMQIQNYQDNIGKMNLNEREKEEERLIALRKKIESDQRQKSIKLEDESASAADELVKEVRKKVAKYGEENNYVYIFGSNESANIMYAKRGKDITLEVIEYINE